MNQDKILNSAFSTAADEVVPVTTDASILQEDSNGQSYTRILNNTMKSHPCQCENNLTQDSPLFHTIINRDPRTRPLLSSGANIDMMTKIFTDLFLHKRSDDADPELKAKSRQGIIDRLSHYTLETTSQEFFAKTSTGKVIKGINIVGVIPGKNRGKPGDEIVLVGARYDSDQGRGFTFTLSLSLSLPLGPLLILHRITDGGQVSSLSTRHSDS